MLNEQTFDKLYGMKLLGMAEAVKEQLQQASFQLNAVSIVNESIQDSIGDRWITDMIVPVLHGELARNKGRGIPVAVFNDFQKISSLGIGQRG